MDLIGQQETARRERDARIAKASADQEAAVREAEASQVKINAERDVSLRRAETEMQIAAADARAAQAGPLAQAEAQQEVTRRQTELAQLEADRVQKNLIASTIRPAEADAEAQIRRAEGDKQARIAAAQAEAEAVKLAGQAEASVSVTKGEAQARITEVNAEATAKQTTLEGNAEAGIVLSKGEAEAKALALRAEAYRQFNEAAVIQTVLSMLPEIVRAAAEPLGRIGSLTVLSNDGASELVKTTTRTVAEAGATVKGLTGLDIPALLGKAMGIAGKDDGDDDGGRSGGTPKGGGGAGSGGGRFGGGGTGGSGSASGGGSRSRSGGSSSARATSRAAGPGSTQKSDEQSGYPPAAAPETPEPDVRLADAAAAIDETTRRAADATRRALADRAAGPPTPSAAIAGIGRDTTVDDALRALANDLRAVPGIERFGLLRLAELDRAGPRPLRALWRNARDRVDARAAELTIGEILERSVGAWGSPPAQQ